jgi:hypothetical protein
MKTFVNDYDFSNLVNGQDGIDLGQPTPSRFFGINLGLPIRKTPKKLRAIDMGSPRTTNPQEYTELGQQSVSSPREVAEISISQGGAVLGIRRKFLDLVNFKKKQIDLDSLAQRLRDARNKQNSLEAKKIEAMYESLKNQIAQLEESLRKSKELNIINAVEDIKKNPNIPIEKIAEGIPEIPKDVVEEVVAKPSKNSWVVPALVIGVIAYLVFKK